MCSFSLLVIFEDIQFLWELIKSIYMKEYTISPVNSSTSLECKNLSKSIQNVDETRWEEEAGNICLPGIRAKFHQNPLAMDTLLYKTGKKRIVECASDCLWGNGVSLGDPACLDPT